MLHNCFFFLLVRFFLCPAPGFQRFWQSRLYTATLRPGFQPGCLQGSGHHTLAERRLEGPYGRLDGPSPAEAHHLLPRFEAVPHFTRLTTSALAGEPLALVRGVLPDPPGGLRPARRTLVEAAPGVAGRRPPGPL